MRESREPGLAVQRQLDEKLVEQAFEAAVGRSPRESIRNGLETAIGFAEMNLERAREGVWALRGERAILERVEERIEACLGGSSEQATLAVGAALQLVDAELASGAPDLRGRMPELLRWLQGDW